MIHVLVTAQYKLIVDKHCNGQIVFLFLSVNFMIKIFTNQEFNIKLK